MKRGCGRSGSSPVLTAAQRERVGKVVRRRWKLRRLIKLLEIELQKLPSNSDLVAEYGVTVQTLHSAAKKTYRNPHKLDAVPRETPN